MKPEINLWPDKSVSRNHARIWFEKDTWHIEDLDSKHGTLVGNLEIRGLGAIQIDPYVEIQVGDTMLMLVPPNWHRLRSEDLRVELEVERAVNYSLHHCGVPTVRHLRVQNRRSRRSMAKSLVITISGCGRSEQIRIPSLEPRQVLDLRDPTFLFSNQILENQVERSMRSVCVELNGELLYRRA